MMTLNEEKIGQVLILGLAGDIDLAGAKIFRERVVEILDRAEQSLLIDFTEVTYLNSTGLSVLILAAKRMGGTTGRLALTGVTDSIQRVLKITGLTSLFTILPTKAEALSSFSQ
jgi:stage II sporulation protein AA (anti-sigma F factor antagonist)